MIPYRPTDGDAHTAKVTYRPRTCFLMTQLGRPIPEEVDAIRKGLGRVLKAHSVELIDANSVITGRDFLLKIWNMIVTVPLTIAVIHEDMPTTTQCNVFYEIGVAQALGKETIVVKTKLAQVPSDFVRTEYIEYDEDFEEKVSTYLTSFFEQSDYYETMADQLDSNPLLAIDYLRRAFLISNNEEIRGKAHRIFQTLDIEKRAKNSVEMLLSDF